MVPGGSAVEVFRKVRRFPGIPERGFVVSVITFPV